jgi:fibronectin type 3 domain-containing protein
MQEASKIMLLAIVVAVLGAVVMTAVQARPVSVVLAWDAGASTSSGPVRYRVYVGGDSRAYTNVMDAGYALQYAVTNLVQGATYYFAVTAVDTNGLESDFSSEVSCLVSGRRPAQPTVLRLGQ